MLLTRPVTYNVSTFPPYISILTWISIIHRMLLTRPIPDIVSSLECIIPPPVHLHLYMDVCSQRMYIQEIGIQSNQEFGIESNSAYKISALGPIRQKRIRHSVPFLIQEFVIQPHSSYRRVSPRFQFSLSAALETYLYGAGSQSCRSVQIPSSPAPPSSLVNKLYCIKNLRPYISYSVIREVVYMVEPNQWCNVSPSPTYMSVTENSWMLHPLDKVSLGYFDPDRTIPKFRFD
jgi:hypothetical protein